MPAEDLLKQAIMAARAGREWTARDMFLRVVETDPNNEVAWMWLTGLLDDLNDRVYACQQALQINPLNRNAQAYLAKLLAEKQTLDAKENSAYEDEICRAKETRARKQNQAALDLMRGLANRPRADSHLEVWRLLADWTPQLEERVGALERLLKSAPQDSALQEELQQVRYFLQNPIHQAELYEEHGETEKALEAYRAIALTTKDRKLWHEAYAKITRLENLRFEHVAHISPAWNIARMTFAAPLTYFMYALIHVGITPLADFDPSVWMGLLWVTVGSFFVALSSVRSHHRLWNWAFKDISGKGSPRARVTLAVTGWLLIALPLAFMLIVAWRRLINYLMAYMAAQGFW